MSGFEEAGAIPGGCAVAVPEFTRLEHATVGSLYLLFGMGGLATNVWLLVTLYKDKGLLAGASPWFHVSLALANIAIVAPAPFPASSSLSGKWLYGDKLCQAYAFEGMFVGMFAIGCIICLCVERYVIGFRTEALQPNVSSFYWLMTGLNVANAFFWAVMPLLGWTRYALDPPGTSCTLDWHNPDDGYNSYMTLICVLSFFLPVVLALAALYKSIPADPTATSASGQQEGASGSRQDAATSGLTESTMRGLCLAFLGLALAGWGPFTVLCVWAMVGQPCSASMLAAAVPPLACKMMTTAYPLAYNIACPRLRRTYLSFLGFGHDTGAKNE